MTNMVLGDSTLESLTLSVNALLKIEEWTLLNDITTTTHPCVPDSEANAPSLLRVRRERERERAIWIWFGPPWGLRINRNHDGNRSQCTRT
jgi:hypothetical protein